MREVGIDLSARAPTRLTLEMQLRADWAVTMGCGGHCPYVAGPVEAWSVQDPAGRELAEVRSIRDGLRERVDDFIRARLHEIRRDRTPHERRLRKLLPELVAEFSSSHRPDEIRGCADLVLGSFGDAAVRSFVLALAHRSTRECLRSGGCRSEPGPRREHGSGR